MEGGEEGGANGSLINFNDYILTLISSDLRLFAAQLSPSSRLNRNETDPQETETGDRRQPAPTRTNPRQPAPTRAHPRPPAPTRAHPRQTAPNRANPRQSAAHHAAIATGRNIGAQVMGLGKSGGSLPWQPITATGNDGASNGVKSQPNGTATPAPPQLQSTSISVDFWRNFQSRHWRREKKKSEK